MDYGERSRQGIKAGVRLIDEIGAEE